MEKIRFFSFVKVALLIIVVFLFYFWIATCGFNTFRLDLDYKSHYNNLSVAFLQGQLNFLFEPPRGLLQLSNPYDPKENEFYRLLDNGNIHDLSLYKGKLYMYFGAVPAIVLYLPYLFFMYRGLPDNFAVFIFSFIGFVFSALLLYHIRNKYFKEVSDGILLTSVGVLAVGNMVSWLMGRPLFYEVAIASGFCFMTGAIYFLSLSVSKQAPTLWMLILGSLFLGLSVGSRPHFIACGFVLIVLMQSKLFLGTRELSLRQKVFSTVALLMPFTACLVLLGFYNYLRFDDPFEFGIKYQLAGHEFPKVLSFETIFANIYLYLFKQFAISQDFPYIFPIDPNLPTFISVPSYYMSGYVGVVVGIFYLVPFTLMSLLSPVFGYLHNRFKLIMLLPPYFEFWIVFLSAITIFVTLGMWSAAVMRYEVDFATLFILTACIIWYYFDSKISYKSMSMFLIRQVGIFLAIISIFFGSVFSFQGEYGSIGVNNPFLEAKLENLFRPISSIILKNFPQTVTRGDKKA